MPHTRRRFLKTCGALGTGMLLAPSIHAAEAVARPAGVRKFHLCVSPEALDADPELLDLVAAAGVETLWLTGFLYGYWYFPLEKTLQWRRRAEQKGMTAQVINVPLGHPGDALGSKSGALPISPPNHWRLGTARDGKTYSGTSLHPPATEENVAAMKKIEAAGFQQVFVDDDFRLARGPGIIGGCFCDEHQAAFLKRTGYGESQWQELLEAVDRRDLTDVLRAWVEFTCDELTGSFRAQQAAAPKITLGNMIMYFGAEKAGIRLTDYQDVPCRVGEMMFYDRAFAPVKGKTDELFSALFHRRYIAAERAFSETTAFPAHLLSAANMAAKLVVSTISDVRTTMYMSGVTAFPRTHWDTLVPAMRRQAEQHAKLAGHRPRGPWKHYWGEASRYVGDDQPYSLFLACGVPFEVTDAPASDGWTFLSEADACMVAAGKLRSAGTVLVTGPKSPASDQLRAVPETLADLWALKREVVPTLGRTPYVEEDVAVVCAWYPTARAVLLWNLTEERQELTLRIGDERRKVVVAPLDSTLVEGV